MSELVPTSLDLALRDLAIHVEFPEVDLEEQVLARIAARVAAPGRRPATRPSWRAVAIAAAVVVAVVLVLPAPRRAVARWLGLGGVEITQVPQTPTVPSSVGRVLHLGRPAALDEAVAGASFEVLAPAAAGPPSQAFTGMPPDGVTLVWLASDAHPEVPGTGLGLLLTEFPASLEESLVKKELGPGSTVETVEVNGVPGYWIQGDLHILYYQDPGGDVRPDTIRLAANTLLWAEDGITYRLESTLDLAGAIDLAEALSPVG